MAKDTTKITEQELNDFINSITSAAPSQNNSGKTIGKTTDGPVGDRPDGTTKDATDPVDPTDPKTNRPPAPAGPAEPSDSKPTAADPGPSGPKADPKPTAPATPATPPVQPAPPPVVTTPTVPVPPAPVVPAQPTTQPPQLTDPTFKSWFAAQNQAATPSPSQDDIVKAGFGTAANLALGALLPPNVRDSIKPGAYVNFGDKGLTTEVSVSGVPIQTSGPGTSESIAGSAAALTPGLVDYSKTISQAGQGISDLAASNDILAKQANQAAQLLAEAAITEGDFGTGGLGGATIDGAGKAVDSTATTNIDAARDPFESQIGQNNTDMAAMQQAGDQARDNLLGTAGVGAAAIAQALINSQSQPPTAAPAEQTPAEQMSVLDLIKAENQPTVESFFDERYTGDDPAKMAEAANIQISSPAPDPFTMRKDVDSYDFMDRSNSPDFSTNPGNFVDSMKQVETPQIASSDVDQSSPIAADPGKNNLKQPESITEPDTVAASPAEAMADQDPNTDPEDITNRKGFLVNYKRTRIEEDDPRKRKRRKGWEENVRL